MFFLFFLISTICSFAEVLDTSVSRYFGYSNLNGNQLIVYTKTSGSTSSHYYRYYSSGAYSAAATFPSRFYNVGAMDPSGNVLIIDTKINSDWNLYFFNGTTFNQTSYNLRLSSSLKSIEKIIVKSNQPNNFQVVLVARYARTRIKSVIFDQEQIVYLNIDTSSGSAQVTNQQIINQKKSSINPIDFNLDPSGNILIAYGDSVTLSSFHSGKINLAYKNFTDISFTKTSYSLPVSLSDKNAFLALAINNFSKIKRLKGVNQQLRSSLFNLLGNFTVNFNTLSSNAPWSLTFSEESSKSVDETPSRLFNLSFNQTNFSSGILSTILNDFINLTKYFISSRNFVSSTNGTNLFFWGEEPNNSYYSFYDFNQKSTANTAFDVIYIGSVAARNNSFFSSEINTSLSTTQKVYTFTLLLSQPGSPTTTLGVIDAFGSVEFVPQLFPKTDTSTYVIYLKQGNQLISEVYGN